MTEILAFVSGVVVFLIIWATILRPREKRYLEKRQLHQEQLERVRRHLGHTPSIPRMGKRDNESD